MRRGSERHAGGQISLAQPGDVRWEESPLMSPHTCFPMLCSGIRTSESPYNHSCVEAITKDADSQHIKR